MPLRGAGRDRSSTGASRDRQAPPAAGRIVAFPLEVELESPGRTAPPIGSESRRVADEQIAHGGVPRLRRIDEIRGDGTVEAQCVHVRVAPEQRTHQRLGVVSADRLGRR